ncbi:MAG: hypothetical protein GY859_03340 [Desulfobacterales bacterium]|nr:hypothetical protein [Desulfobacterales bacterium]
MARKRTRRKLKDFFKKGAKPTAGNYSDFIDSVLNAIDDGVFKPEEPDKPIKIDAHGLHENLLDFGAGKETHWRISQKPGGRKAGFNLSSSENSIGDSRLYIDAGTGNMGVGGADPRAKLHVRQTEAEVAFRVDDDKGEDATPFIVRSDGRVGVGSMAADPRVKLEVDGMVKVNGALRLEKGEAVNHVSPDVRLGQSDASVPTQKAVKNYVDAGMESTRKNLETKAAELTANLSFPKGGIIMWSGASPPAGWALCDGSKGTPDLRGRFVLGSGQGQGLADRPLRQRGGEENHALTMAEMPKHDHAASMASAGSHKHTFTAWKANFDHAGRATESCNDDDGDGTFTRETASVGDHNHAITQQKRGSSAAHNNMPPYFVLAYIMKL